jgi:transcriptional regulator with XRE-family HTH domain
MRRYSISESEWLDTFSNNLSSILAEYNMTQRELADASGVAESSISHYINKQRMPTIKSIVNIAHALDMEIDEIMDFGYDIH